MFFIGTKKMSTKTLYNEFYEILQIKDYSVRLNALNLFADRMKMPLNPQDKDSPATIYDRIINEFTRRDVSKHRKWATVTAIVSMITACCRCCCYLFGNTLVNR